MGLLDWIRGTSSNRLWDAALLPETYWALETIQGMTADEIWRSQPAVRTVVGFTARNIARLGLHTFVREGDERKRTRTDPVAQLLAQPNPQQTTFELFNALISDYALSDNAYLVCIPDTKRPSGWILRNVPSRWVSVSRATPWEVLEYKVMIPGRPQPELIPAEFVLHFHGWNPADVRGGVSPLESLKDTMAEQVSARKYRKQVWDSSARAGAVITRPQGTQWSDEARERFIQHLKSAFAKDGSRAGSALVLEDGMTINKFRFSAHEEQFVEAARLSLETVAMVYFINPTMIGQLDNANYSNMKEFRKALYGETLGAPIEMIQERLNTFLVPKVTAADVFVEWNVEAQMRGSFEEQAAVLSTSTGAPWLTRNEVRAMQNRPAIEGGDELIVPLNVLVGGQASPQDAAPGQASALTVNAIEQIVQGVIAGKSRLALPAKAGPVRIKAKASGAASDEMTELLAKFFRNQGHVVRSRLGAKDDGWWDEDRWNTELAAALYDLALKVSAEVGRSTLDALGIEPDRYDVDQTLHYMEALAANTAGRINTVTKQQLDEALASDEGLDAVAHVFEKAEGARAEESGPSIVTGIAGFAAVESLKQNDLADEATKTWWVTSAQPRPSHARMNGETVPLSENFSNGAAWPGDQVLGVDEIAGCQCELEMTIP